MKIIPFNTTPGKFLDVLEAYLPISRFVIPPYGTGNRNYACEIETVWYEKRSYAMVNLRGIRLKNRKPNCGQHTGPCRLNFKKHQRKTTLEGADWVGFNDMLNDICDANGIEARITSKGQELERLMVLRSGRRRRDRYYSAAINGQPWAGGENFDDFYDTHFGERAPAERSDFTIGTPGIPEWLLVKEAEYAELFEDHEHEEEQEAQTA